MSIKWQSNNLYKLGCDFLAKVLTNMGWCEESFVQFGETGTGKKPNYQVKLPSGVTRVLLGSSHDTSAKFDKFYHGRISKLFTLAEIKAAYDAAGYKK
mgnify:CR=1 FL=1